LAGTCSLPHFNKANMKIINFIFICTLLIFLQGIKEEVNAQEYNPSLQNASMRLDHEGSKGMAFFDLVMENQAFNYDGNNGMSFTVCFLNAELEEGLNSVYSIHKDKFEWLIDTKTNCIMARQKTDLRQDEFMSFSMNLSATRIVGCEEGSKIGFNANIQPAAVMNKSNQLEDDQVSMYTCQISTNGNSLVKGAYQIYPNPASTYVNVEFTEKITGSIEMFNVKGQVVKDLSFKSKKMVTIKVHDLVEGSYLIRLHHPDKTYTDKINISLR